MRLPVLLSVLLLALVCVSSVSPLPTVTAQPQEATAKVFVNSRLINLFQQIVNRVLEDALTNMVLPDSTSGKLQVTNINIRYIKFTAQDVGLTAPNRMAINLNNLGGQVTFNWKYKGPLGISFKGSAVTTFKDTSLKNTFSLSSDSIGRPIVHLDSCSCSIGDLSIKLSGGGSWLFNIIIKLFKGTLKKLVQSKVTSAATTQLNAILAGVTQKYPLTMPLTGSLFDTVQLNVPLVATTGTRGPAPFSISNGNLVGGGNFFFSSKTNTTVDPRPHTAISDNVPSGPRGAPMFGMAMSEQFLGSLLFTLTQNGKLEWHVDNDSLPPSAPFRLNTHLVSSVWPTLYAKYPNHNMTLDLFQYEERAPTATASVDGNSWSSQTVMVLSVVDHTLSQPMVPVAQLLLDITLDSLFGLHSDVVGLWMTGKVSPLSFKVSVLWTAIESPATLAAGMQLIVSSMANDFLVPIINGVLATGLQIGDSKFFGVLPISNVFLSYGSRVVYAGFDLSMPALAQEQDEAVALLQELQVFDE